MLRLLWAEIRRSVTLYLRYPSEAITGVITFTAVFFALFLGIQFVAGPGGPQFGARLDTLIITYLIWSLTLFALGDLGWTLQWEAQTGTLEQLFLSPFGPLKVFVLRAIADQVTQLLMTAAVLVLIQLITGRTLHFTPLVVLPLLSILAATYGLGLMLGGLALIFKRVQSLLQLSEFILLFMIVTPVERWHGALQVLGMCIPLAPSSGVLRQLLSTATPDFNLNLYLIGLLNGLVYFLLGLLAFSHAERAAKQRGLLGGY